jgi:hypothetical protein
MKKLLAFALPALFVLSFTACGPSEAEEKKQKEEISKDMRSEGERLADSMTKAMEQMAPSGDSATK